MAERRRLFGNYVRFRPTAPPEDTNELPITNRKDDLVTQLDVTNITSTSQLNQFRSLAEDRQTQYSAYDEMKSDSIIAAALELYADDATQYDEQGRVIWVESDDENITKAGNRLLDLLELPERAWKHIYQTCLYGDYYLKLYRPSDIEEEDIFNQEKSGRVKVINDKTEDGQLKPKENFLEYAEDVDDPATVFDLRKRGKTAGYIEVGKDIYTGIAPSIGSAAFTFQLKDIKVYPPNRFVHIMLAENLSRTPEEVTIEVPGKDDPNTLNQIIYKSARGKSVLQDVYPIQKELQLLEDSLLLNRLTRSSLIRLLEIELGDMPKKEVNAYLRRIKNLIEQHISMDKDAGTYKSFNAPGPIDNVIYIPVRNGKGSISVNNLGGDVNVRDIADIDYFNNKRAGALKIPRAYLGDDMDGSGLSNGGSLTRLSIRYARTIKRIQIAYTRAITQLLNLFFIDKKLDYVNKFTVKMTSPSTQEDLERNELIGQNIEIVSSMLDLTSSLEGDTQKKVLEYLVTNFMKMPEIAEIIKNDSTPEDEVSIDGTGGPNLSSDSPSMDFGSPDNDGNVDMSGAFENTSDETPDFDEAPDVNNGFTDAEFAEFEDNI